VIYEVEIGGRTRQVAIARVNGAFLVTVDGRAFDVDAVRIDRHTLSLIVATTAAHQRSYEATIAPDPASGQLAVHVESARLLVALDGRRRWGRRDDGTEAAAGPQRLVSPMPGKIVRVLVQSGEAVRARQPLVVVEAMKMENELRAGRDGKIAELHAQEGQSVDAGALLVVVQ